ncbi:hypothetical protein F183_A14850 [Bryobacterales bacterium F-183]|nr:hypothetical protein F183_A14850 [Bryobacterales bacterium F-183]
MQIDILLPEIETMQDGEGPVVDTVPASCQSITLGITQTLEREKLDVSIWGSPDGSNWGARPLAEFPAKSYCGLYSLLLDLSANPNVRFLQAKWKMRAWGAGRTAQGTREPLFSFYLRAEPVTKASAGKARAAAAASAAA